MLDQPVAGYGDMIYFGGSWAAMSQAYDLTLTGMSRDMLKVQMTMLQ